METYTLGYKFRIYPNRTQENLINRTLGCARFVFNHFLAVRRDECKGFKCPRMGLSSMRNASRQRCECRKEHPAQGF